MLSTRGLAELTIDKMIRAGQIHASDRSARIEALERELELHDRRMALKFMKTVIGAAAAAAITRLPTH